jgi:hypothetical protein
MEQKIEDHSLGGSMLEGNGKSQEFLSNNKDVPATLDESLL